MAAIENIEQLSSLFDECAEDKEYVWETSEHETSRIRFEARNNFIFQFQEKMKKLAGDVLDLCKDLIDANKDWMYKEYKGIATDIECKVEEWNSIFRLCIDDYHNIKRLERQERTGESRYYYEKTKEEDLIAFYINERKIICERTENGKTEKKTLEFNDDNDVVFFYVNAKDTPEYKLCSRLSEYIYSKGGYEALNRELLESLAQMVCLYIALKNEKAKLYRQNRYFPKTQTKATEGATKTKPEVKKAKKPESTTQGEEDKTTLAEKKMDKEWIQKVFTARANKYFAKAIEAGYMQETETGYLWTFNCDAPMQALACFLIRLYYNPKYKNKRPPYKELKNLFGIESSTQGSKSNPLVKNAYKLVNTGWYSGFMMRQSQALSREEINEGYRTGQFDRPPDWFYTLLKFFAPEKQEEKGNAQ